MILHSIILCVTVLLHISLLSETPIVPVPHGDDLPANLSITQYAEGYELIEKTTHFTQAGLHFLKLISNDVARTAHSTAWVHECKQTYSILNILHHKSTLWLMQLSTLPQKGIIPSKKEWLEITTLAREVQKQKDFVTSSRMQRYLQLIAHTEAAVLASSRDAFITQRIRTYSPPSRW